MPPRQNRQIDWPAVRARIAKAMAATETVPNPSASQAKRILDARAHALARVQTEEQQAGDVIEALTFALANERYAIETRYVREVVRFTDFTPVPGAPDFVVGVANLRGDVLSIFDLRRILGISTPGLTDLSRIIVFGEGRAELGVLADAVHEVRAFAVSDLLDAPGQLAGGDRRYVRGVSADALIMLDGSALLDDERLFVSDAGVPDSAPG